MIRNFLIIFLLEFIFAASSFAAQELIKTQDFQPENLEQLNQELLKQKEQMDPFATQEVKVDLESLGLDDVDEVNPVQTNKGTATNLQNSNNSVNSKVVTTTQENLEAKNKNKVYPIADPNIKKQEIPIAIILNQNTTNSSANNLEAKTEEIIVKNKDNKIINQNKPTSEIIEKDLPSPTKIEIKPQNSNPITQNSVTSNSSKTDLEKNTEPVLSGNNIITDKIKNFSNQQEVKEIKESKIENKTNATNQIEKPSKEKIAAERKRITNERKQKIRTEKLEKLRKEYLINYSQKNTFLYNETELVIPKKRNIDKFVSYENPAPPIMETLRTDDNFHIPSVLTYKDKIDNLFKSISSDNISYFKSIYDEIGRPNLRNENGDTILTYSLLLQKHDVIASILLNGADPNLPNSLGYTPLEIVIELADSKSLKLLANNNVNINYVDAFKRTYLMHAVRVGFLPAVEFLIKKGTDVNAMDEDGFSALAIAYRHKKDIIIKYLLKHGAKPWVEKPYDPSSQFLIKELQNRWKN